MTVSDDKGKQRKTYDVRGNITEGDLVQVALLWSYLGPMTLIALWLGTSEIDSQVKVLFDPIDGVILYVFIYEIHSITFVCSLEQTLN